MNLRDFTVIFPSCVSMLHQSCLIVSDISGAMDTCQCVVVCCSRHCSIVLCWSHCQARSQPFKCRIWI